MAIVDPSRVRPIELKTGDVMVCTVALHVMPGNTYRIYRAPWPPTSFDQEGVPQGGRIADEETVMGQLFPVAGWAELESDNR